MQMLHPGRKIQSHDLDETILHGHRRGLGRTGELDEDLVHDLVHDPAPCRDLVRVLDLCPRYPGREKGTRHALEELERMGNCRHLGNQPWALAGALSAKRPARNRPDLDRMILEECMSSRLYGRIVAASGL